jgi:hypothetical protein
VAAMNYGWTMFDLEILRMEKWLEDAPKRRHEEFLKALNHQAALITQQVIHEIQVKFREAFPNRWYFFLVQRPRDVEGGIPPWGLALKDRERAEAYEHRVTPVQEIRF